MDDSLFGPNRSLGSVSAYLWDKTSNSCFSTTAPNYLSYVTIASSTASMLGSALIILTFVMWRDMRTVARAIVVFLSVADFFTAAGYLFGAVVYLHYHDKDFATNRTEYNKLCEAQSFVTSAFPISSFLWTAHLAIYLYVSIVNAKPQLAKKLVILFHVTGWGIPLAICVPVVATGYLGPANSRTSVGWCFIAFDDTNPYNDRILREKLASYYGFEFLCGKFWEIATYFVALALYLSVKIVIRHRKYKPISAEDSSYGSLTMERKMTAAMIHLDQKLIFIPLVFILLRMWGTIRFFISFHPSCHKDCGNIIGIGKACEEALYNPFLMVMQALCDPGQGWGNALIFVIFHKTLAKRLCPCIFFCGRKAKQCCRGVVRSSSTSDSMVAGRLVDNDANDTSINEDGSNCPADIDVQVQQKPSLIAPQLATNV